LLPVGPGGIPAVAVRCLAFKWIRIFFRCWKNRQTEGEARYLKQLQSKGVSYFPNLQPA